MSKTVTTENKLMRSKALTLLLTMIMPLTIWAQTDIDSLSSITDMAGNYRITSNINAYLNRLAEDWDPLPPHFVTSSETRQGRDELLNYIEEINREINNNI